MENTSEPLNYDFLVSRELKAKGKILAAMHGLRFNDFMEVVLEEYIERHLDSLYEFMKPKTKHHPKARSRKQKAPTA